MKMNHWLLSIVHVIFTCTAAKILYVLPDDVSDHNCPSQPCATLGQYLLDNGSLPVLSNVVYYFLPGEYHVVNAIDVVGAYNISLVGFGTSPVKFLCWPKSYVSAFYSYNVTIKNLVFNQCNGILVSPVSQLQNIAAGLFLYECSSCKIEDVYFFGYGFTGINLFLNSHLNNLTIDLTVETLSLHMCSTNFFVMFVDTEYQHYNDSILVNNLVVSGYSEMCYEYHTAVDIQLHNRNYNINVELWNSLFHDMDRIAINAQMEHVRGSLLIKNCTFENITHKMRLLDQVINVRISTHYATIKFEYCEFYSNAASTLLVMEIVYFDASCTHPSNITFKNCSFYNHDHGLLKFSNDASDCKANVFLNEMVKFVDNKADKCMMEFSYMVVKMDGAITLLDNKINGSIIDLDHCDVTFSKTIKFISNVCQYAIYLMSLDLPYIIIMEHANIMFNQSYADNLIYASGPVANDYDDIFPYCMFQYTSSTNIKFNISESLALYAITFNFTDNKPHRNGLFIGDFITHCKWLPTAVFNGYNPGYVNQQIVNVDGLPWTHSKALCYCPYNKDYNCTIDLFGPVYPGQKLEVELCIPQGESDTNYTLFVETYSTSLPNTACKIAHQTELVNTIGNYPKTFHFTIISAVQLCELFLTVQSLNIRTAFYVQLSPCPVGFTLQNGKCDCDPFLPPDIDTCYIDLSAITRPANTWITAHTLTNNTTNYLISDCPMDYCLPYSTNVNLLYPDLQCQFNRTGILCSQCQHPLSMVFASSRCMKCTNVHILITIIIIVAGIVLVVLLYFLNLTVTKGTITGIIFYANIVSINDSVFLVNDNVFKPLRVFISFTNLDLGIETCFYDGMDSYAKMWLQLFFPSYLIIIAVSIIIASRYSSRKLRLTYSRSLPVLATLYLLSYTGVLRVVLTVLFSYSTITEYPSGDKEIVWSIDASTPLFGLKFTILFITCLVLFLLLILFSIALFLPDFYHCLEL